MVNSLTNRLPYGPLKTGLLIAASAWFLLTFHELTKAVYSINEYQYAPVESQSWILVTDVLGLVGIIFRVTASIAAVAGIVYYLFSKKDTAQPTARSLLRWIVMLEALYWIFSFFPSGIWGLTPPLLGTFVVNTGIPCLIEGIVIPAVLVKLFIELGPNRPAKGGIKWGLIAGTAFIFIFWLNNTCNWINVIMQPVEYITGVSSALYPSRGIEYLIAYADNIFSFGLTVAGLFVIALYAAYFTKKSIGTKTWRNLDWRKIGAVVTAVGMYFLVIYVMWIAVGTSMQFVLYPHEVLLDVKWSEWYAWFLGHNIDIWVMALPLVGVPLMFAKRPLKQEDG